MGKEKTRAHELKNKLGIQYTQALVVLRREHSFRAWVERIIAIAAAYEARWKEVLREVREARVAGLPPLHHERRLILPADTQATRARTTLERSDLIGAIGEGTDVDVGRLAALAWSGREITWTRRPDVTQIRHKVDHGHRMLAVDGRDDMIRYLAALGALSVYVTEALRHCKRLDLSVPHGLTPLAPRLPPH